MNEEVQEEVDDIARKTRIVPIIMLAAVLLTLGILGAFALGVDEDAEDGRLTDESGVIDEEGTPAIIDD